MPIDPREFGAVELIRLLQVGALRPEEVVEASLARLDDTRGALNAVITPLHDSARARAREFARLSAPERGRLPLFGLPVSVKGAFAVAGTPLTAGCAGRRAEISSTDAEPVARLRQAGAVIVATSSLPELSAAPETENRLAGRTANPWDARRSAGGSSGGEGALVAAGISALGLGADIAGSVRLPAAFCGVVGLKPSAGRVPTTGHFPADASALDGWNCPGPLGWRVADVALGLSVLSGAARVDLAVAPSRARLRGRRLLCPPPLPFFGLSPAIEGGLDDARSMLADAGMEVTAADELTSALGRVTWHVGSALARHWLPVLEGALAACGGPAAPVRHSLRAMRLGRGLATALGLPRGAYIEAVAARLAEAMQPGGVLLWPVFPRTAPAHGFSRGLLGLPVYTGVFNALGFAALSLPMGLAPDGLPTAVQIVARRGEEEAALTVAAVLEAARGPHSKPVTIPLAEGLTAPRSRTTAHR